MFFAISSWIDINGLWVEVPLMVNELPEAWDLPSYLVIIIQIANVGPLTYTLANRLWPNRVKEWPVVYVIISIGATACILMTFFWQETTVVAGELHSTALFVLTTCLSIVDCTSSVVYLPYMAGFKAQYMSAYYIGEGLSGLIPGLVGLMQGLDRAAECVNFTIPVYNETTGQNSTKHEVWPVYEPPNFSVEEFFYFLFAMLLLSALCFTLLHFLPYCRQERIDALTSGIIGQSIDTKPPELVSRDNDGIDPTKKQLSTSEYAFLLLLIAWANGLTNGVIPSTQSYTCLPYGQLVYTLSVRLSTLANPLACFLALFYSTTSTLVISVLSALGTVLAAVQLYLAAMSPTPPLQGEVGGEVLAVLTSVLITAFFSYVKVVISTLVMGCAGRRGLLWVGVVTQAGSLVAAIITFICVTHVGVFASAPAC
ncbi:hypothetical protein CAPTEDRAFT_210005 [Capitella teleta]|uniref:Riboflavin transporter n=1 Tax=Capitella teleta TaxID=283909 RepID=R7V8B2_CAPTE|nr:hypothetical protein CAPTEDRAFT_210005 [Capitella teleta]|eukprot:ELU14779.1 hypothetical protein CAPTEDRAFT_210005 [Capitella teleta]